jgi:hypothetical protein
MTLARTARSYVPVRLRTRRPPPLRPPFCQVLTQRSRDVRVVQFTVDQSLLNVQRVKIADFDGNERLPILSWCGDPIQILSVVHPQSEALLNVHPPPAQGAEQGSLKACDKSKTRTTAR